MGSTILLYLKALILSLLVFIAPINGILIFVGFAIFMDTAFGLWASYRLGNPIVSRKLYRLVTKMLTFNATVILFYGIDLYMFGDLLAAFGIGIQFALTKIVGMSLICIEGFSIDEKLQNVYGKGRGIFYFFRKLVGAAKEIKKGYNEVTENFKEDNESNIWEDNANASRNLGGNKAKCI